MMDIRNCDRCGRAFLKNAPLQKLCPQCVALEDEEFIKVKEYLYKHPNANIDELERALEVPKETILRFMQGGRLTIKGTGMVCNICGMPIERGTMCPECQANLVKDLQRAQHMHGDESKITKTPPASFHSAGRRRK